MQHLKEYDEILKDMQKLNLSLTEDEMDMLKFIDSFGSGYSPEDFAEYLYDYQDHPEEFDIDGESEYYDLISDYYYEIKDCARFDLSGPMRTGNFKRWDSEKIEDSDVYKLYKKMSQHSK